MDVSAGSATLFALSNSQSGPEGIASGPDGNLWFTESTSNMIGRITPSGSISEFPLPHALSGPEGIVSGPDGNLWFTEYTAGRIGRISP